MPHSVRSLVEQIHRENTRVVLATSGGGSRAIAELLQVPGASRTVLEAVTPYCETAMIDWLGGRPDHFCTPQVARSMALVAFNRARKLDPSEVPLAGVACTAGLASDRPKRGPHRAHVALQTASRTATWSIELQKERRRRIQEERLVSRMVLNAVADGCGIDARLDLPLLPGEQVEYSQTIAPAAWQDLLLGRTEAVCHGGGERLAAIFPGAFNPLHAGHRRMMELAQAILGVPVALELSVLNADKPPLDYAEIERRLRQFPAEQPVWLTRAATFEEKSRLFPGADLHRGRGHAAADRRSRLLQRRPAAVPHRAGTDCPAGLDISRFRPFAGRRAGAAGRPRSAGGAARHLPGNPARAVPRGHLFHGNSPVGGVVVAIPVWQQATRWWYIGRPRP